jgi:hypothetical protein
MKQKFFLITLTLVLFIIICNGKVFSQQKIYKISFSSCLNKDIPKDAFQNKYVILDFWQTW